MKLRRIILGAILSLVSAAAMAQPALESFFGLKLGEKYNEKTILNAIFASGLEKGKVISRDTLDASGLLAYSYGGIKLTGAGVPENETTSVSIIVSPDYSVQAIMLDSDKPGFKPVCYLYENASPDLMHLLNTNVNTVDDTFFGISLGSSVSLLSVTKAIGNDGAFFSSGVEGNAKVYIFKDVNFSDHIWNYAVFSVTRQGKLAAFTVYDVCEGVLKGPRMAYALHHLMRDTYHKKYNVKVPLGEDGWELSLDEYTFSGLNGVDQVLSLFPTETPDGKLAVCVQMEFVDYELNKSL